MNSKEEAMCKIECEISALAGEKCDPDSEMTVTQINKKIEQLEKSLLNL
jgi:hypothetical protein